MQKFVNQYNKFTIIGQRVSFSWVAWEIARERERERESQKDHEAAECAKKKVCRSVYYAVPVPVQLQQFPLKAAVVFRAANVLLLTLLSIAAADNNIR